MSRLHYRDNDKWKYFWAVPYRCQLSVVFVTCKLFEWKFKLIWIFTPPPVGGRGIVFAQFLSLFVSLSATLRENGWTDLHEIFREGVDWPWDNLIKFWVNSDKQVGRSKVNLLLPAIAQSQLHSLGGSMGRGFCGPHHSLLRLLPMWYMSTEVVISRPSTSSSVCRKATLSIVRILHHIVSYQSRRCRLSPLSFS